MKIVINDIKSDKDNILRFVSTIFNNKIINSSLKDIPKLSREYTILVNKYSKHLKSLFKHINSDDDYRINEITRQLNEVFTYFNGVTDVLKVTTSIILKEDINKVLIKFLETKYSDLLKIEMI